MASTVLASAGFRLGSSAPVATGDIDDGAVATAKLAVGGVTTAKVADGAVTLPKLAAGAASLDSRGGVLLASGGIDLAITTDQALTVLVGASKYVVRRVVVCDASANLAAGIAAGGLYTAAAKAGTAIVAAIQVYTALSAASKALDLTVAAAAVGVYFTGGTLYFSLTTASLVACTASILVFGDVLG